MMLFLGGIGTGIFLTLGVSFVCLQFIWREERYDDTNHDE